MLLIRTLFHHELILETLILTLELHLFEFPLPQDPEYPQSKEKA